MRLPFTATLVALLAGVAACSGKVTGPIGSDGGLADGGSSDASAIDTGPSCDDLAAALQKLRDDALTCCPICNSLQCGQVAQDICCPISVTSAQPAFESAAADYKARCQPGCPKRLCAPVPSGNCKPVDPANPSGRGVCQ